MDPIVSDSEYSSQESKQIDINETGYQLNSDTDAMFEIKLPDVDIKVRTMVK